MNIQTVHKLIFVFVLAFSANVIHGFIDHEHEVCDVCLSIHSFDDVLPVASISHAQLIEHSNYLNIIWIRDFVGSEYQDPEPIRGPPLYS